MTITTRQADESMLKMVDKENGFLADVKWDGCIHLNHSNIVCWEDEEEEKILQDPHNDVDYIHICDLDQWITFLTEMREKAKSHFGPNWPR